MPRLRVTASISALVILLAVAASVWMSAWPRMHDRATEAAVAARAKAPPASPPPPSRAQRAPRRPVATAAPSAEAAAPPSPQLLYAPSPRYPIEALRAHREGVVVLRVQLDARGHVGAAAVERSSGDAALDASALEAVRQWRFQPAAAGSSAATLRLPVRFRIGAQASAAQGQGGVDQGP